MTWVIRDGEVLATLEVAESALARSRGLLGRDHIDGALLLSPARSVHTLGMRFTIDVAFLDAEMVVLDAVTMEPWRVGLPRVRARSVLEASGGAFERWRLKPGDKLEVKGGTACVQPPGGKNNGAAVRRTAVPAPAKPARQPGAGGHADRQPG